MKGSVRASVDAFADEIFLGLDDRGVEVDKLACGGKITEAQAEVGVIDEWASGRRISIFWRPKTWEKGATTRMVISFARTGSGTPSITGRTSLPSLRS